ncbi:hypothetical protein BDW59DRAFT_117947 [Aspergillus cavernicola]|uniref:Uncharacterized protein n=1 Tax=Aspergillus cavernicola TaxID=176166 RepID=A0ABR4HXL5_9EURO
MSSCGAADPRHTSGGSEERKYAAFFKPCGRNGRLWCHSCAGRVAVHGQVAIIKQAILYSILLIITTTTAAAATTTPNLILYRGLGYCIS